MARSNGELRAYLVWADHSVRPEVNLMIIYVCQGHIEWYRFCRHLFAVLERRLVVDSRSCVSGLPADAVILSVIAASAPKRTVIAVYEYRVEGAAGAAAQCRDIPHFFQGFNILHRSGFIKQDLTGPGLSVIEAGTAE